MELLKAFGDLYGSLPDIFWYHFLCFWGTLLGILIEKPKTLSDFAILAIGSYFTGFYMYGVISEILHAWIKNLEAEQARKIGHFLMAVVGKLIIERIINFTKSQVNKDIPSTPA